MNALVARVELIDTAMRVSIKLPIPITEEQPGANADGLIIKRVFPMQIRRQGFEMRLVIEGSGAPAARADLALLKTVAQARQRSEDLLTGRA